MATYVYARRVEAEARTVWNYLSWDGPARLAGKVFCERIDFDERRPLVGAIRRLHFAEGPPLIERLEAYDEADMFLIYRFIDNGPLPVTDYEAAFRVIPSGPGACCVKWEVEYTPVGIDQATYETGYTQKVDEVMAVVEAEIARNGG